MLQLLHGRDDAVSCARLALVALHVVGEAGRAAQGAAYAAPVHSLVCGFIQGACD